MITRRGLFALVPALFSGALTTRKAFERSSSPFAALQPFHFTGGDVPQNKSYLIGENVQETLVSASGRIVNRHDTEKRIRAAIRAAHLRGGIATARIS